MLYALHEAAYNSATPVRMAARAARDFWGSPLNPASGSKWGRTLYASADLIANLTRRYGRPAWGIDTRDGERPARRGARGGGLVERLGEAAALPPRADRPAPRPRRRSPRRRC